MTVRYIFDKIYLCYACGEQFNGGSYVFTYPQQLTEEQVAAHLNAQLDGNGDAIKLHNYGNGEYGVGKFLKLRKYKYEVKETK